jgi:hypothetical protein
MKLINAGGQFRRDFTYPADGTIASASLPQLVLPEHPCRSSVFLQNTSSAVMWWRFGGALATCTITNGVVQAPSIVNAGFNYTRRPKVHFYGGGIVPQSGTIPANSSYVGGAGPDFPAPIAPAKGIAVMTGSPGNLSVASISLQTGGAGYVTPPMVFIENDVLDPRGAFDPSAGGGAGFQLYPGQSIYLAHSAVPTDALAVFCATATAPFACYWTP